MRVRSPLMTGLALGASVALAACSVQLGGPGGLSGSPAPSSTAPSGAGPSGTAAPAAAPAGPDTLLTEPDQGFGPVYALIAAATSSVDLTMYELSDTTAEAGLAAAA